MQSIEQNGLCSMFNGSYALINWCCYQYICSTICVTILTQYSSPAAVWSGVGGRCKGFELLYGITKFKKYINLMTIQTLFSQILGAMKTNQQCSIYISKAFRRLIVLANVGEYGRSISHITLDVSCDKLWMANPAPSLSYPAVNNWKSNGRLGKYSAAIEIILCNNAND